MARSCTAEDVYRGSRAPAEEKKTPLPLKVEFSLSKPSQCDFLLGPGISKSPTIKE